MNHLSHEEQEKILDFYFRCGQQEDIDSGRDLIAANPGAAKLYARLEETLTDLDHIKYEPCPDNLVDLTIARLKLAASMKASDDTDKPSMQLHQLLEKEQQTPSDSSPYYQPQPRTTEPNLKPNFHHRMGELLAAAASIIVVFSILFPVSGAMRNASQKIACQNNFRQIGTGLSAFDADHKGQIAEARIPTGNPWWKVGQQSPEAYSNTRYPWQLVKQGYVQGKVFVCKGNAAANPVQYDPAGMNTLYDFPSRSNITYSFMLFCDDNADALQKRRKVTAADLNPLFQQVTSDSADHTRNEFDAILLDEQLKQLMSSNHRGKGQNVLYCDGSVAWITVRTVSQNGGADDIFTIQNVTRYTGKETPTQKDDTFLAP